MHREWDSKPCYKTRDSIFPTFLKVGGDVICLHVIGSHGFVLDNLRVKVAMANMLENTIKLELVNIIQHCYYKSFTFNTLIIVTL